MTVKCIPSADHELQVVISARSEGFFILKHMIKDKETLRWVTRIVKTLTSCVEPLETGVAAFLCSALPSRPTQLLFVLVGVTWRPSPDSETPKNCLSSLTHTWTV